MSIIKTDKYALSFTNQKGRRSNVKIKRVAQTIGNHTLRNWDVGVALALLLNMNKIKDSKGLLLLQRGHRSPRRRGLPRRHAHVLQSHPTQPQEVRVFQGHRHARHRNRRFRTGPPPHQQVQAVQVCAQVAGLSAEGRRLLWTRPIQKGTQMLLPHFLPVLTFERRESAEGPLPDGKEQILVSNEGTGSSICGGGELRV